MNGLKKLKIPDLLVNPENYRFKSVQSQKEAINLMINNQGEKLYNLAQHITENGINPTEFIFVSPFSHDKNKFIVLEGNRRVVALKALHNPEIIDMPKHIKLKKKFQKLHHANSLNELNEINCILFSNPLDADKWIKLKHAGQQKGVGVVEWNAHQIQNFEEKTGGQFTKAYQVIKFLQESSLTQKEIKEKLQDVPITSFNRLLDDPQVRDFLGLKMNNGALNINVDEKELIKALSKIIKDLLKPSFKVKDIYTKKDRKDYIESFPEKDKPEIKSTTKTDLTPTKEPSLKKVKAKKVIVPKRTKKRLIPSSCKLQIGNTKVNRIYKELMALDITKYPNAVATLFRVFVELSLDCFLENQKMIKGASATKSNKKLEQKVKEVIGRLKHKKVIDDAFAKGINVAIKDPSNILGIDTFHAYLHNHRFHPSTENLIITWDNIQPLMEKLWENVK